MENRPSSFTCFQKEKARDIRFCRRHGRAKEQTWKSDTAAKILIGLTNYACSLCAEGSFSEFHSYEVRKGKYKKGKYKLLLKAQKICQMGKRTNSFLTCQVILIKGYFFVTFLSAIIDMSTVFNN